ncbi:hypothetical protein QVD99_002946 [Batrachochytrium dendrobatidis]|nr:hypothetical protein QVD99_002946 [Batrachochytrium dendrobatidis]
MYQTFSPSVLVAKDSCKTSEKMHAYAPALSISTLVPKAHNVQASNMYRNGCAFGKVAADRRRVYFQQTCQRELDHSQHYTSSHRYPHPSLEHWYSFPQANTNSQFTRPIPIYTPNSHSRQGVYSRVYPTPAFQSDTTDLYHSGQHRTLRKTHLNSLDHYNMPKQLSSVQKQRSSTAGVTKERKYICEWESCGKSFYRRTDVTRHMKIHYDLRPFACDWTDCSKSFRQRSALRIHRRRIHLSKTGNGNRASTAIVQKSKSSCATMVDSSSKHSERDDDDDMSSDDLFTSESEGRMDSQQHADSHSLSNASTPTKNPSSMLPTISLFLSPQNEAAHKVKSAFSPISDQDPDYPLSMCGSPIEAASGLLYMSRSLGGYASPSQTHSYSKTDYACRADEYQESAYSRNQRAAMAYEDVLSPSSLVSHHASSPIYSDPQTPGSLLHWVDKAELVHYPMPLTPAISDLGDALDFQSSDSDYRILPHLSGSMPYSKASDYNQLQHINGSQFQPRPEPTLVKPQSDTIPALRLPSIQQLLSATLNHDTYA